MTRPVSNPNLPRGLQAFLFEAAERRRSAEEAIVATFAAAGLREVILPVLDYAAPYAGVTAEGDELVYRFVDRRGELLSLRADFTPMAARVMAPRLASANAPVALFYRGDVVRDEPSGVGRAREFAQVGAERYGDSSFSADETMFRLAMSAVSSLPAGLLSISLGYAGLLEALLAAVAPSLTRGDGRALRALLEAARERRVTRVEERLVGAGAKASEAREIARCLLVGFAPETPLFSRAILTHAASELARIRAIAAAVGEGCDVVVDLAGTPSAPYYTGLTFGLYAAGSSTPLIAGGRYDNLLSRFGRPMPAVGFSIGIEAFASAQKAAEVREASLTRPIRLATGKGRLLRQALDALRGAGIDFAEPDGRRLVVPSRCGAFELLLLKDDDVPTYVAHGGADLGIVGSDRVAESSESVFVPVEFPFGICRLALIGRVGEPFAPDGHPVTVGTKYARLASRYFDELGVAHEIVPLAGSVELAAALRLTDVVVDLIETGTTIAANGLREIETILESRAVVIVGRGGLVARRTEIAELVGRLAANLLVEARRP